MRNVFKFVNSIRPATASVGIFLVAVLSLLLSNVCGIFKYTRPDAKEAGYMAAVNWSLSFTVFVPAFAFFILSASRAFSNSISEMVRRGMIRDSSFDIPQSIGKTTTALWDGVMRRGNTIFLVLTSLAFAECVWESIYYSVGPLLHWWRVPENKFDWSVAFLGGAPKSLDVICNATFAVFVYLGLQWTMLVGISVFLVFVYCLCVFMSDFSSANSPIILFPDLNDSRLGMEACEDAIEDLLVAAAFGYGVFLLSRLWNAFLTSTVHTHFGDFLIGDISDGFRSGSQKEAWYSVPVKLLDLNGFNFSGFWVALAAAVFLALSFCVLIFIMRVQARYSKTILIRFLQAKQPTFIWEGKSRDDCLRILDNMEYWPVSYPKPNVLLTYGLFAMVCIIFVRLGLFYMGLMIYVLVRRVTKTLSAG